ncbi:MAG: DUF948 domain-containing protein [Actinomycetota bacterium]
MSWGEAAALIAAVAFMALVAFVGITLGKVREVLGGVQGLLGDLRRTAIPLIEELRPKLNTMLATTDGLLGDVRRSSGPILEDVRSTIASLPQEMKRVDSILAAAEAAVGSAEDAVSNVAGVTKLVSTAAANPIIKSLSFLAGARAGVGKIRNK